MPLGQKTKNIKQKQYWHKFNKDLKDGPYQKRNLKKKKKDFTDKNTTQDEKF